MTGRPAQQPSGPLADASAAATLADLARLLRQLRRRQAREQGDAELTHRELAAKTGWSHGIIGAYLSGQVLPPTDRFDVLIRLLGATRAEQGALATARDRIEELRRGRAASSAPLTAPVVPRQLPPAMPYFVGRGAELDMLNGLVERAARPGGAVAISAIGGSAGIGKTALAVYWAHQVADRFPDGQLYVDLHGFDPSGSPVQPAEAVRGFLEALGIPAERVPASLQARTGLYRTLLSTRRVLVVLDNARDAEQASPLLPGTPGCVAVVTSRNQLNRLVVAEGAEPVRLDLLSTAEARELLIRRLGERRVSDEPGPVREMIDQCARLPLALSVVAARAAANPTFSLATVSGELRETHARLDALDGGESAADVRAVFSWSYQNLSEPAARLFRLLGLHTGRDIGAAAAASLAALPEAAVRRALAELTRVHLIEEHVPGRFACHDLLRAYAAELARGIDPADQRGAAQHRTLDHYLHTAHRAARLMNPYHYPVPLDPVQPGVSVEPLDGHDAALAWFTAEHAVLLDAIRQAVDAGFDRHAWQLAWALVGFLDRCGHWDDCAAIHRCAVQAASRLGDRAGQAHMRRGLGIACARLGRYQEAHSHLRLALDLYHEAGDDTGQAHTHRSLAWLFERQGRYPEALRHARLAFDRLRAAGHQAGQAQALNAVGWCHAMLGNHRLALHYCRQALDLHQTIGDRHGEAGTWDSLGYVNHHLGDQGTAITCYRRAIDLCRDLGDRFNEAETLTRMGDVLAAGHDPAAARAAWCRALTILDELGHADTDTVQARLSRLDAVPRETVPRETAGADRIR